MKRFIPLLLSLALSGCFKVEPAKVAPAAARVYTVDEFLAQPEVRKMISAACSNDPGRMGQDPNCINVRRAGRIASAGTLGGMPKITP
jgi:hypothetical protein